MRQPRLDASAFSAEPHTTARDDTQSSAAILVGHSYGGAVITEAALANDARGAKLAFPSDLHEENPEAVISEIEATLAAVRG